MKKVLKIVLIIVLILLLISGALLIWQWDNIKAITASVKYTPEVIDTLVTENENKIDEVFSNLTEGGMLSELTEEEQEKLLSGEMSEEEIEHIKEVLETPKENKEDVAPSRVDEIISKIYVLRADFVGKLNSLEQQALEERLVIKQGGVTITELVTFVNKYTSGATSLEKECDSKMNSYIKELEAELERLGMSTSIISEIRSVYKKEKELKKSQLLSKYSKYL